MKYVLLWGLLTCLAFWGAVFSLFSWGWFFLALTPLIPLGGIALLLLVLVRLR